jgi:serine/threonine-protein phosphatase PGAM5
MPEFVFQWFKGNPEPDSVNMPEAILPWLGVWPGFENLEQIPTDFEQARQAWEKYFIPAKGKARNDIIVCHGNLIRYFIMRALQAPPEGWIQMDIYNCSICEITIDAKGCARLISHNDSGHLHADQVTLF